MKARYMVENPDDLEMTCKITMTMREWEELRDQLSRDFPSWRLSKAITSMLADARKVFYAPEIGPND